jgi:carbon storage regulator CsrA
MLVLTRKANQTLTLGDDITITVVKIQGNSVRLGIAAPSDVSIRRGELGPLPVEAVAKASTVAPALSEAPALVLPETKFVIGEAAEFTSTPPHRVLIIDDNPEDRATYRRLMSAGKPGEYLVSETESGEEGLRMCRNERPDCVLLDYRLPDLNGLEFLAELSSGAVGVPVVMLTGHGDESIAVEAMKGGAQDYLVKRYITGERLQSAVYNAMARGALRSQLHAM